LDEEGDSAVDVEKEIVAFPPVPTAVVSDNAGCEISPIAGTVTYAACWSWDVSIFNPVVPPKVAVTAGLAAKVRPLQVTVTDVARSAEVTVKTILSPPNEEEDEAVGDEIPQRLAACAVM